MDFLVKCTYCGFVEVVSRYLKPKDLPCSKCGDKKTEIEPFEKMDYYK